MRSSLRVGTLLLLFAVAAASAVTLTYEGNDTPATATTAATAATATTATTLTCDLSLGEILRDHPDCQDGMKRCGPNERVNKII
jgi:hypothetical protein